LLNRQKVTGVARIRAVMPAASGTTGTEIRNHTTATSAASACPIASQGRSHWIVVASARASNVNDFDWRSCRRIMTAHDME